MFRHQGPGIWEMVGLSKSDGEPIVRVQRNERSLRWEIIVHYNRDGEPLGFRIDMPDEEK